MELLPNEYYQHRKEVSRREVKGVLGITNLRVVWMEGGTPSLYFPYSQIAEVDLTHGEFSLMRLSILNPAGGNKRFEHFKFDAPTHNEDSEASRNLIISYKAQSALGGGVVIVPENVKRQVVELTKSPMLALLHRALVREGDMLEEEFWRLQPLPATATEQQVAGRIPAVFELHPRPGESHRQVIEIKPALKQQLFRQYPELRAWFNREVPHLKTEREFWKAFGELQAENGFSDITVPVACSAVKAPELLEEDMPAELGCHRRETADERSAFIISKFNKHSARIVSEARLAPPSPPAAATPMKVEAAPLAPEPAVAEVATSPDKRGKVLALLKAANPARTFPTCFESEERMKHIFRLAHMNQLDSMEVDARPASVSTCKKFFDLLKYFYSLFPVDSVCDVKRLDVVLRLMQEFYDDQVTAECDFPTRQQLADALGTAYDRVDRAKAFVGIKD